MQLLVLFLSELSSCYIFLSHRISVNYKGSFYSCNYNRHSLQGSVSKSKLEFSLHDTCQILGSSGICLLKLLFFVSGYSLTYYNCENKLGAFCRPNKG